MENNAENRAYIARMTIDGMTHQELQKALHQELCIRYVKETGLFDSVVQTFKDMDMLGEGEQAICVHCDESHDIDADHECKEGE